MERSRNFYKTIRLGYILISVLIGCIAYNSFYEWQEIEALAYIIHSGFISGYQNRYGDNLKPPTNVYHRMTA